MTSSASFDQADGGAGKDSLDELYRAKGARPIETLEEMMVPGIFSSDEEVDEFIAAVREWRQADLG